MDRETVLRGDIVDSWVEPAGSIKRAARLVLQVKPRGRPRDLMIVEASTNLVPDRGWLEDLGENLCHGSLVEVTGRVRIPGHLQATQLDLER